MNWVNTKNDPAITGRTAGVPGLLLYGPCRRRRLPLRLYPGTPHDEFQLILDNVASAAIALGLSLLGFVLPVVSAIAHSANRALNAASMIY
jgi:hypothetical protein